MESFLVMSQPMIILEYLAAYVMHLLFLITDQSLTLELKNVYFWGKRL